jgi:hypothetical protein
MNHAAFESSQTTNGNSNDGHTSGSMPPVRESMDVITDVEVQCPLHLAPLDYLENNNVLNFDFIYKWKNKLPDSLLQASRGQHDPEFVLKMTTHSSLLFVNKLHSMFKYMIKSRP